MLRVLTLSTLYPDATRPNFGVFVEQQTRALAALPNVDVRVVSPLGLPPFPLDQLPHYRALGRLPVHDEWRGLSVMRPRFVNLPASQGRWHAAMLVRALRPVLKRIAREFPFDIIDAEFFFPDGPAAVALGREFGVPVSIKARGADIHHWGRAPATAAQVQRAGMDANGLLAVSQALVDDMAGLGMDPATISVHRTGIDRSRFGVTDRATARIAMGIHSPLIVSVGALIPRKGHDVVIDAMARLPGVHLQIAGDGPERERLSAQIAALDLQDRVTLLGSVSHDQLPQLLAAADVMALASTSEGLANAWVEALASGTPIVISDAGGARELVDRPAAGQIVERTAECFAAAIADLLTDPPPREAVAATVERYSWETNAAQLHDHLQALVERYRDAARR